MNTAQQLLFNTRAAFKSGITLPVEWRIEQLNRLLDLLNENENALLDALHKDLRKPKLESIETELIVVKNEAINAIKNVQTWSKPTYPSKAFVQMIDSVYILKEPYGVVLVMSAWNYPIQIIFSQLVGIIASGNCAIIKPSELSPVTSELMSKLIPQYLDKECFRVYLGGIPETTVLLKERFDMIMYTGSSMVGKIVMKAAAEHLTPVILELGGKSPVYVHKDSDLKLVAKRVVWGKFLNLGQTCTAPDYILCHNNVVDSLIDELRKTVEEYFGSDPKESPDLARIVNARNFKRIESIMSATPKEKLAVGGETDESALYIVLNAFAESFKYIFFDVLLYFIFGKMTLSTAPTVYKDIQLGDPIMEGEIFGPILPVLAVNGADEAVEIINSQEKPLALYIFAKSDKVGCNVSYLKPPPPFLLSCTSSGGVTVNDVLMHAASHNLPFGGVGNYGFILFFYHYLDIIQHLDSCSPGNSGMGRYHGKYTFDALTHEKPVVYRGQNFESLLSARYPPYSEKNLSMVS
uniref:Aldehyde dehydrogenase n=1 Tax=Ciona savignyi TaxID=51511 RepID=H2ZL89_CIOSA